MASPSAIAATIIYEYQPMRSATAAIINGISAVAITPITTIVKIIEAAYLAAQTAVNTSLSAIGENVQYPISSAVSATTAPMYSGNPFFS